jgi:hypothetical protein
MHKTGIKYSAPPVRLSSKREAPDDQVQDLENDTNHLFQRWAVQNKANTTFFQKKTLLEEQQGDLFKRLLYLVAVGSRNQQQMDTYVQSGFHTDYARLGLAPNRLGRGAFRAKRGRPGASRLGQGKRLCGCRRTLQETKC